MKRFLLVVAALFIAVPATADVIITATNEGSGVVNVGYINTGEPIARAFALDITVSGAATFERIYDFHRGPSTSEDPGYGIFPGMFRDCINPEDPNWYADCYTPVCPNDAPDANGTGLGTNRILVEMGCLYDGEANKPTGSGTLFRIDVNSNGASSVNLTITANLTHGGIALEDGSTTSANLPIVLDIIMQSGYATNPYPADAVTNVGLNPILTWTPGAWVQSINGHQVWFNTSFSSVNMRSFSANKGRLTNASYTPGTLAFNKRYYWRIDEYNDAYPGTPPDVNTNDGRRFWGGAIWQFVTGSQYATNPQPANGATGVSVYPTLSWTPGILTQENNGHDVYFGTNYNEVNNATTGSPLIYQGRQSANSYHPAGPLEGLTTYYWRIDEVNYINVWKGTVWGFETISPHYRSADLNRNYHVDFDDFVYIGLFWLATCGVPYECEGADIYPPGGDGTVDYLDLTDFAAQWLTSDPLSIDLISAPVIPTNSSMAVTIASIMIDPCYIPEEVTLLRDNTRLGEFRDDGTGGDEIAGDGFFTIQPVFLESAPTTVTLRMSAIFAGIATEFISQPYSLEVVDEPIICPEATTVTLDANGVFVLPDIRQSVILNQGIFSQSTNVIQEPAHGTSYDFPQTLTVNFTAIDPCTMFEAGCSTSISIDDLLPPVVLVEGVEPGQAYSASECVTPVIEASDNFDPNEAIIVEAALNGSVYTPGTPICVPGRYDLQVTATDASGNITEYPEIIFSVVDTNTMKAAAVVVKEFTCTPGSLHTTLLVASNQFDVFEIDGYTVLLHLLDGNGMFMDYTSIAVSGAFDSNGYTPQNASAYFHYGFWELTFDVNDPLLVDYPDYLLLTGSANDGNTDWVGQELLPGPDPILPVVSMAPHNAPLTLSIPDPNAEDALDSAGLVNLMDERVQLNFPVEHQECCPPGKWKMDEKIGQSDKTQNNPPNDCIDGTQQTWMYIWAFGGYIGGTATAIDECTPGLADDAASAISKRSIKIWLEGCHPPALCCDCEITLEATPSFKAKVNLNPPGLAIAGGKIEVKGDLSAVAEGAVVSGTELKDVGIEAKGIAVSVPAISVTEGKQEKVFSGNDAKILGQCEAILSITGSTYLKVRAADALWNWYAEANADIWEAKLGISIDAKCKNPVPICNPGNKHFELE